MNNTTPIDIDELCELIIAGNTYRQICDKFNCSLGKLADFISNSEHSARARAALKASADSYADKGEEVLKDAPSTMTEIQRAKELAQHYRWRASKRNPTEYAERIDSKQTIVVEQPLFQLPPDVSNNNSHEKNLLT